MRMFTTKSGILCLAVLPAALLTNALSARVPLIGGLPGETVESGKELGGAPPVSKSANIQIPGTISGGVQASAAWKAVDEILDALEGASDLCSRAYAEVGGSVVIRALGVVPYEIVAKAQDLGIAIPANVLLADAGDYDLCGGFRPEDEGSHDLNDHIGELARLGGDTSGPSYMPRWSATSISCYQDILSTAVSPVCYVENAAGEVSAISNLNADYVFSSMASDAKMDSIFSGLYHIRDVVCDNIEVHGPDSFSRLTICSYEKPFN